MLIAVRKPVPTPTCATDGQNPQRYSEAPENSQCYSYLFLCALMLVDTEVLIWNLRGIQMADAMIASTALSVGLPLLTANDKHYRFIDDLETSVFRP